MENQDPVEMANQLIEAVIDSSQEVEHGIDLACHKTTAILFTCTGKALEGQDRLDALLDIHGHVMTLQESNEYNKILWGDCVGVSSYDLPPPNFTYLDKTAEAALEAIEHEVAKIS